jgi:hypothetical protein
MAAITQSTTLSSGISGVTVRYLFRYVLDNGEVHYREAWVAQGSNEATVRAARAATLLAELADAEFEGLLS